MLVMLQAGGEGTALESEEELSAASQAGALACVVARLISAGVVVKPAPGQVHRPGHAAAGITIPPDPLIPICLPAVLGVLSLGVRCGG